MADTVSPSCHQHQYRVVVTVIQDMTPIGIKASASPTQLFRFDTPALSTSPAAASPAAAAAAASAAAAAAANAAAAAVTLSGEGVPSIKCFSPPPPISGGLMSGGGSVEFNSEVGWGSGGDLALVGVVVVAVGVCDVCVTAFVLLLLVQLALIVVGQRRVHSGHSLLRPFPSSVNEPPNVFRATEPAHTRNARGGAKDQQPKETNI